MSIHQHATLEDTVYLWFGANDTSGSGGDGASPVYDVRLAGAAAGAIPVLSGSATLLTHANYPDGCHEVAVAATDGNGFAAGNTYAVFCTLLVDSQNPTGFIGSFTLGPIIANAIQISGDSTAADNLELQYDGTGLNGDLFPSTQAQVSQIGSGGGSANNEFAILSPNGFVITTGLSEVNNEDATRAVGGDVHQISDNGGTLDVYYLFEIGGAFSPNTIVFDGRMNGNNDDVVVSVNTNTQASPSWVERATLEGSNSSVNLRRIWPLVGTDQMTGADAGKVAVRFQATGLGGATLTTDQILVEKTTIASLVGYANGQVWVDTVSGTAGVVVNVNGVADKAVDSWASAVIISGNAGLANDFHVINGSTIALTDTSNNFSIFGDNWTLQLESRSVAGAYFQGAHVSGISTSATEVHFEGCDVATASVQKGHFDFCSFSGTVTHTLAGDYNYHNCYSGVAGSGGPTFAKTAGQAITAQWRGWKGSINLTGLQVGDTLTIGGDELGIIDLGSPAGAVVVEIRGIYKELTNIGSAAINLDGAINAADVSSAYAGPRGPGVYLNDAAANTNTVNGFDGTLFNPVSTIAAVKTITDSLGFKRVYLVNDSSATLTATMEGYEFVGIGEMSANSINFGSQDVDNTVFHNLLLTGAQGGTGRCQAEDCVLSTITGMEITALRCLIADAGSLTLRNDCAFDSCFSAVAGAGTPTLNINSVASVNVYFRHYSGGLKITNAVATTVMSYESDGQLVVDATCTGLTVVPRGNLSITDNGTSTNINLDAAMNRTGIQEVITGGAYPLDTDANGRIRIVDGTGTGEIDTTSGAVLLADAALDKVARTHTHQRWFVSKSGNDSNSGKTWATAFLTIGAAKTACANGDWIIVSVGTYTENIDFTAGAAKQGITLDLLPLAVLTSASSPTVKLNNGCRITGGGLVSCSDTGYAIEASTIDTISLVNFRVSSNGAGILLTIDATTRCVLENLDIQCSSAGLDLTGSGVPMLFNLRNISLRMAGRTGASARAALFLTTCSAVLDNVLITMASATSNTVAQGIALTDSQIVINGTHIVVTDALGINTRGITTDGDVLTKVVFNSGTIRTTSTGTAYDLFNSGSSVFQVGPLANYDTSKTSGTIIDVDNTILADTNELQGNQGDWATATGFNTVVPPSVAQFNARTLVAASYSTASALSTHDGKLDGVIADLPNAVTKNTALAGFPFFMVLTSDHVTGGTGLSVTAERSIDGAAFAGCANAVAEIANGVYKIDLAASDLNGDTIMLKFTAATADARLMTIVTQPT